MPPPTARRPGTVVDAYEPSGLKGFMVSPTTVTDEWAVIEPLSTISEPMIMITGVGAVAGVPNAVRMEPQSRVRFPPPVMKYVPRRMTAAALVGSVVNFGGLLLSTHVMHFTAQEGLGSVADVRYVEGNAPPWLYTLFLSASQVVNVCP